MAISAAEVKELRERTGAGMMECKNALVEADGDIEKAIEAMRKAGQAKAVKKAGRIAAEGLIVIKRSDDERRAVILEINSETDFVARDSNFVEFANKVGDLALASTVNTVADLSALKYTPSETVEEARHHLVSKLGEHIGIRRLTRITTSGVLGTYLHNNRIGVVVDMINGNKNLAKDIAMHIAASAPMVVSSKDVSAEWIAKEREIFSAQAQQSGKPPEVIEKMIDGRIKKYIDEVSLLGQPFIKDVSISISELLKAENATVKSFVRFLVGEGIEKKEENFAQEVMAQVRGD